MKGEKIKISKTKDLGYWVKKCGWVKKDNKITM